MAHNILLEAGTNEMEMLLFRIGGGAFGINVAKVKEIIRRVDTVRVPMAPHGIEGSFLLRDEVLTLINLAAYLEIPADPKPGHELIIIVEFDKMRCGVLVDAVEMIHRVGWDRIEPPSPMLAKSGTPVVAMTRLGDTVVQLLDFEAIVGSLLGGTGTTPPAEIPQSQAADRGGVRVLAADDSFTIRASLENLLRGAGFEQVTMCTDGQHAWETLESWKAGGAALPHIVLSDIEMPRVDGLHLCMRIKQDPVLRAIPVVLFSSIIREETRNKGEAVGADAQITKFDVAHLLATIDQLLAGAPAAT